MKPSSNEAKTPLATNRVEKDSLLNAARAAAPHTEEAGEVCTADCQGCNDPVAAIIADRNEARAEAFRRGKQIERLLDELTSAIEQGYRPNLIDMVQATKSSGATIEASAVSGDSIR